MHAADWIALITPATAVGAIGVAGIVKLTRLVDAVERLTTAMERIAGIVDDHEHRLTVLETDRTDARS